MLRAKHLQTVACGCPGGRIGKAEISATRRLETPKTFPFESATAMVSLRRPILPRNRAGGLQSVCSFDTNSVENAKGLSYRLKQHDE